MILDDPFDQPDGCAALIYIAQRLSLPADGRPEQRMILRNGFSHARKKPFCPFTIAVILNLENAKGE